MIDKVVRTLQMYDGDDPCGSASHAIAERLIGADNDRGEGERDDQVIERVLTAFEDAIFVARRAMPPLESIRA